MRAATGRLWRFTTWFGYSGDQATIVRQDPRPVPRSVGRAPLAFVFLAMTSGILLDRQLLLPQGSFAAIVFLAIGWFVTRHWDLPHAGMVLLFALLALSAASWHRAWMQVYPSNDLSQYAAHQEVPCIVDGRLLETPRVFPDEPDPLSAMPSVPISRCRVEVSRIRDGTEWKSVRGRGRLIVQGALTHVGAGDLVRICGYLDLPADARNPGELSRKEFAQFRRDTFRLRATRTEGVKPIQAASAWNPQYWLARFRDATEQRLRSLLPESVGNLSVALLLGAQECVEQESIDAFLATGTLHLLSISGLHVMILASALLSIMLVAGISDKRRILAVMGIIVVYAIFTGGRPPVVRASMAIVLWGCESLLHRNRTPWNALCAAGILVLLINPTHLFHAGAQLSFLAMFGILVMFPQLQAPKRELDPLDRLIQRSRPRIWRWIVSIWHQSVQTFQLSTLLWLISLPLVAAWFHVVSVVAVAMNLVMWLPVWIAMVSGFAMLILIWLAPPLAGPVAWLHSISLETLSLAGDWGERISPSHLWVAGPGPIGLTIFYLVTVMGFLALRSRRATWALFATAIVSLAILWPMEHRLGSTHGHHDRISAWILSIGHGSCVVLEMPTEVMVYDAGCLGNERFAADTISRFLWSRRIERIDTLVISHADIDHFCAVPRLIQRFPIGRLCLTRAAWSKESRSMDLLRSAVVQARIPIQKVFQGDVLWSDGMDSVRVLHPTDDETYANDNAGSIVLAVRFGADLLLLPGDLEKDGMVALTKAPPIRVDVAMAPHHGSIHSMPDAFVQWCRPQSVIVSGGKSTVGPAESTYRILAVPAWHTATDGALSLELDRTPGVRVHPWRIRE